MVIGTGAFDGWSAMFAIATRDLGGWRWPLHYVLC